MKKTQLLGNEIAYVEPVEVSPNKENIVFCHGFDSSYVGFMPLMNLLNDKYNCFGLDYPAHGQSKGSYGDMSLTFFAKTVKEFIKVKNLNNVTLVGHSLGGGVVSYLEKEEFVSKIILLSPINPSIVGKEIGIAKILLPKVGSEYKETMNSLISDWNNVNKKEILDEQVVKKQLGGILKRQSYMTLVTKDVLSRDRQWEILWNYLNFKSKTLLVFGDNDKIIPTLVSLKWLEKLIDNLEVNVIENCGHCPHMEKLNETYEAIASFMKNQH